MNASLIRNCPTCNRVLSYKSKQSFYNSDHYNKSCSSCVQKGSVSWCRGLTKNTDDRMKRQSEKCKITWEKAKKEGTRISWNKGLKAETDERVKNNVEKTRKRLLELHKENKIEVWNKGKAFEQVAGDKNPSKRQDVREKIKTHFRETFFNSRKLRCNYNRKACDLFDEINKEMGWNGIHALNSVKGEYHIKELGYNLDFYEPTLNIVIEYYELWHNKTRFLQRDILRQNRIESHLNCKFYIIKEREEHLWRETLNVR